MIVKGIIQTIDFNSNTCTVRLPFFENAGNESEVITSAIFSTTPGIYNGYKVGDVVFVEFENSDYDQAIVTGKLYLGAAEEGKDGRGAFNISNLTVDNTATIPITTRLSYPGNNETAVGVEGDLTTYKSIEDIARCIQKQETQIGSINAQFIDDGEGLGARVSRLESDDSRHEAMLQLHAEEIEARVTKTYENTETGFGWTLDENGWKVYSTDSSHTYLKDIGILSVDNDGVQITGELKILDYPKINLVSYRSADNLADIDLPTEGADDGIAVLRRSWGYDTEEAPGRIDAEHSSPIYVKEIVGGEEVYWRYVWKLACDISYIVDTDTFGHKILKEVVQNITYETLQELDAQGSPMPRPMLRPKTDQALIIAQGKSTNYYSAADPSTNHTIKNGDCWFDIGYTKFNTTAATPNKDKINAYYEVNVETTGAIKCMEETIGSNNRLVPYETLLPAHPVHYLLKINSEEEIPSATTVFYKANTLKQYYGNNWVDIGAELVLNKLTANYINAMDIIAKKIEVKDSNSNTLFKANGINDGSADTNKVRLANFIVEKNKFYTSGKSTLASTAEGVYIGNDGISVGSSFNVSAGGAAILPAYTKTTIIKYSKIDYDNEEDARLHYTWWNTWTNSNWSITVPTREDGKYIWEWSQEQKGNDELTNKGKVCITGPKGDPGSGSQGRSVLSVTKYYKLAASTPAKPTVKEPAASTGWKQSPDAWTTGNKYYESDRTIYDSVDGSGNDFSWSNVIENSMLSVDFINSLGITAKKITVKDSSDNTVFLADASSTTEGSNIKIGGFNVDENSIKNGALGGTNSVIMCTGSSGSANIGGSGSKAGWAFTAGNAFGVLKTGAVYASNMNISGGSLKIGGANDSYISVSNDYQGQLKIVGNSSNYPDTRYGADKINAVTGRKYEIINKCIKEETGVSGQSWAEGTYYAYMDFNPGAPTIAGPYVSDNIAWKQGINLHTWYPENSTLGNPDNEASLWVGFEYKDHDVPDHGFAGDTWCNTGHFISSSKGLPTIAYINSTSTTPNVSGGTYVNKHIGIFTGTVWTGTNTYSDVTVYGFKSIDSVVATYYWRGSSSTTPTSLGTDNSIITKTYKSGDYWHIKFWCGGNRRETDNYGIEYWAIGELDDEYIANENTYYPRIITF